VSIEVELWSLPIEGFGRFIAGVPPPLSIGTIRLADDRHVKGFLVEAAATQGAREISSFGGGRAYLGEAAHQPCCFRQRKPKIWAGAAPRPAIFSRLRKGSAAGRVGMRLAPSRPVNRSLQHDPAP